MHELNEKQRQAAEFMFGTAAVIAIPGSGKTLTMAARIGHLVESGIAPEKILGLTFTRNVAGAMREKLRPVLLDRASLVPLSTIHSFCHRLLKEEGRMFEVVSGRRQVHLVKRVIRKASASSWTSTTVPDRERGELLSPLRGGRPAPVPGTGRRPGHLRRGRSRKGHHQCPQPVRRAPVHPAIGDLRRGIGMVEGVMPNVNGNLEEERRIAFVAMSRAMKRLYLSWSVSWLGRPAARSSFITEALAGELSL